MKLTAIPAGRALLTGLLTFASAVSLPAATGSDLLDRYTSWALQGNLTPFQELIANIDPQALSDEERLLVERFRRRFVQRHDIDIDLPQDELLAAIVGVYRTYWTRSLMGEMDAPTGEAWLHAELARVLVEAGVTRETPSSDKVRKVMAAELQRRGFHLIHGVTQPLFELMVWRRHEPTNYEVELTDLVEPVRVVFLSDFAVYGWSHWATFGRSYPGGWAAEDALYCLREDYDLDSENFRVSYLKHEARHFADYRLFPGLEQAELEYRAKLTEAAFAESSLAELLAGFERNAASNPDAPHAWANQRVIDELSEIVFPERLPEEPSPERWAAVDPETIHAAARLLLARHTAELGQESSMGPVDEGKKEPSHVHRDAAAGGDGGFFP